MAASSKQRETRGRTLTALSWTLAFSCGVDDRAVGVAASDAGQTRPVGNLRPAVDRDGGGIARADEDGVSADLPLLDARAPGPSSQLAGALGAECERDEDCTERHCVESGLGGARLCCDTACDGPCQACGDTGRCETAASTDPSCQAAECGDQLDCPNPGASRCDATGRCAPCDDAGDCAHVPGRSVCATAPGSNQPSCVECDGDAPQACAGNVCNDTEQACTNVRAASADLCDDCRFDAECQPDQACVLEAFGSVTLSPRCLPLATAGQCGARRPFGLVAQRTSVDGAPVSVCALRFATCISLTDVGAFCTGDADCGRSDLDDGICLDPESTGECAVRCSDASDCPGSACSGGICSF